MHLQNLYFFSVYCVPGSMLYAEDTAVNKEGTVRESKLLQSRDSTR